MPSEIRVAKSGKNALTESNPNNFIFHSAYNTFKIIATGTVNFSLANNPSAVQYFTVAHSLDYIPFVIAFCKFPDGYVGGVGAWERNNSDTWFAALEVDADHIYFGFWNTVSGSPQVTVKYYIVEVPL